MGPSVKCVLYTLGLIFNDEFWKSQRFYPFFILSFPYLYFALQSNALLMKPWIVWTGISLVLVLVFIIFALIKLPIHVAVSSLFYWVPTARCLKWVWLYKAEVEEDNGLRGYLDYRGKLTYKNEDGEVLLE